MTRDPRWHGLVAFALLCLPCSTAHAQAKLNAHYVFSLAGISIGEGDWIVDIAKDRYSAKSTGQFTGMWRVMLGSNLASTTRGAVNRGRLVPAGYDANFSSDDDIDDVHMTFRDGTVDDYKSKPPFTDADRIALAAPQLRGSVDPLTSGLIPDPGGKELLAPVACQRSLPIFDGTHRFDMALSFKRMDQVKVAKGYQGPAIVCAMTYQPIGGYNPGAFRVKYLKKNRNMEMWFAPIPGSRVLAMIRISVPTALGTLVLGSVRFEGDGPPQ